MRLERMLAGVLLRIVAAVLEIDARSSRDRHGWTVLSLRSWLATDASKVDG